MVGIDLFSGAGGMSTGAVWAGVDVRVAVESDPRAAMTYSRNHPGVLVLNQKIEGLTSLDFLPIRSRRQQLIVFGGPPCQGFSISNQRTRSVHNPVNWLFSEYLRFVKLVQPEWVVFENVKGILETERAYFLRRVISGLKQLGYTVSVWLLDASDFGVPQNRARVFVIGSIDGVILPEPGANGLSPVTVRDAIYDLPVLRNGAAVNCLPYRCSANSAFAKRMRGRFRSCTNHLTTASQPHILERYKAVPQGGNWADIPRDLMHNYDNPEHCHTGIYRRLHWDRPSVVIGNFRKNMLIHPSQNRGLSIREAARLQSFPDSFVFCGSIGFQQQQVGNAVPPLLAKIVFEALERVN